MAAPKLKKADREKMLEMIAAREDYAHIAHVLGCSVQNVRYHASQCTEQITELRAVHDAEFLNTGHRAWQNRVKSLSRLVTRIERRLGNEPGAEYDDTLDEKLDAEEIKIAGNGSKVSYKVFNQAEVNTLRGLYDDIAKETGGRSNKVELSNPDGTISIKTYLVTGPDDWPEAKPE